MANVVLETVTKRFGDVTAVDELSLDIPDAEFLVLLGPSGCGKSTALRMVAGLDEPSSGTIAIGDRTVNDVLPKDRDVAMVFQSYALYPHLSVAKNIEFPLRSRGVPREERRRAGHGRGANARPGFPPRSQAGAALRWPAPAGGPGAGHRQEARGLLDGRAPLQPRRRPPGPDPGRHRPSAASARGHHVVCDARPGRGDDDGSPDRRDQRGPAPAGRKASGSLLRSGQHLRRPLHR